MSSPRPSPSASATEFKEGTVKKGNDGNMWIISLASNGTKRWKKYNGEKPKEELSLNNKIKLVLSKMKKPRGTFYLDFIKKVKYVGNMYFGCNILIGDVIWKPLNLQKGSYDIYLIDDSPMIVHESVGKISKIDLKNIAFTSYTEIGVDMGVFGFWDSCILDKVIKDKRYINHEKLPMIDWSPEMAKKNSFFLMGEDINIDYDGPVAFMASTGIGDGGFECLTHGRKIAVLCGINIYNYLEPEPED